jgi:hypothetical protein
MAAKRYTLSEAALASGASPKVIRNWLDRGQVPFAREDQDEPLAWHRFSVRTVFLFSVMKRLVDHGLPVDQSALLVSTSRRLSENDLTWRWKSTTPAVLVAAFTNIQLFVWRTADGELRSAEGDPTRQPNLPDTFVYVDLRRVAEAVADALADLDDDPPLTNADKHLKKNAESRDRKLARALAKQKS